MQAVLSQQEELLGLLLACGREKEICLIASNDEGLCDILGREEEAVLALQELEKSRDRIARELAAAAGATDGPAALSALAGYAGGAEDRQALIFAGERLSKAVAALRRQNDRVGAILRRRLGYTDYMLNLLCAPCHRAQFYDMQGNRREKAGTVSRLDYHV